MIEVMAPVSHIYSSNISGQFFFFQVVIVISFYWLCEGTGWVREIIPCCNSSLPARTAVVFWCCAM